MIRTVKVPNRLQVMTNGIFLPLVLVGEIGMSPASREGCNSSAYFQNCLQVLVFSFPKIIAKAAGDALEFAATP
jgi:hypothetical protein